VISADSRQVYKGLDIGSGKITKKEMRGVPHYLLDVAHPRRQFSVARFQRIGTAAIKKILAKGKLPIICGGTGLYIDSLIYDSVFPEVSPQSELRENLERLSTGALFQKLKILDTRRAASIDRHNRRRLIRALEIVITTGLPVPSLSRKTPRYDVLKIGIKRSDKVLRGRVSKRLLKRLKGGMIAEVKGLHTKPAYHLSWERLNSFGLEYRYVSYYLRGLMTREEMFQKLLREQFYFIKRQLTWWRQDTEIIWIETPRKAFSLCRDWLFP